MDEFCCFCSCVDEESLLVELSTNLLLIDKSHYEFTRVFNDLFGIVSFVYIFDLFTFW